jgi:carbamoyltransferase
MILSDKFKISTTNYAQVSTLLINQKIVAMFQGKSEAGPRALGNRSILFDPRNPDAQAYVNRIKKREWFRPFAGSILKEHAKDWVDMAHIDESPFMMYAFQIKKDKKAIIPGIVHADGSCRMQTVTEHQNIHFYRLIKSFYEKTGVPILFNTSFNLGGEVLVQTVEDALDTLSRSDIDYLYLPEIGQLICTL